MSPTLDASIGTAFIHTIQALQFSKSALSLIQLYPTGPIRLALYGNAVDSLTAAFTTIHALSSIQIPANPTCLNAPAISYLQDRQLIVKFAENQTMMAISKVRAATRYIDQLMLLISSDDNDVLCLLVSIRTDLAAAQTALVAVLNMDMPP